jgi:integrase
MSGAFSAHKYNKYLDSLSTIYIELLEWEAVDANIIHGIKKRKMVKQMREVLTKQERKAVVDHLKESFPEFRDFVQVFFHSGIRITELLTIKISDVDLASQSFKVLVKKDTDYVWKKGIIKDIALPYWRKLVFGALQTDYLFSWGLVPGQKKLDYNAIRLRWTRNVQKPLGITVGIYQLKHSNLDEITELLSMEDAARMANHNDIKMVRNVYAVGEKDRQIERLKRVGNEL